MSIFYLFSQVPAVVVIIPLLSRLGRVKCYCGTFLGGGICCGLVAILSFVLSPGGFFVYTYSFECLKNGVFFQKWFGCQCR